MAIEPQRQTDSNKPRTREELEALLQSPEFRGEMMDGFVKNVAPTRLDQILDDLEIEESIAKNEADINPSSDAMSLEDAYGSVKPSGKPEDFKQITAIAKQAKAEQTVREMNEAWTPRQFPA